MDRLRLFLNFSVYVPQQREAHNDDLAAFSQIYCGQKKKLHHMVENTRLSPDTRSQK